MATLQIRAKETMPSETAISMKARTDEHFADSLQQNQLIVRGPLQRQSCWTNKDKCAFLCTVSRKWICTPIFIIARKDETDKITEEVFDGAHKLESVFGFIDNKFALEAIDELSPLYPYNGMKFKDLPSELRDDIKKYEFTINYIKEPTASDEEALAILWERLNKSGQQVNDFEIALPFTRFLLERVINPVSELFTNTILDTKAHQKKTKEEIKPQRGNVESQLMYILCIADSHLTESHLKNSNSKKKILRDWRYNRLGRKISEIKSAVDKNCEKWVELMTNGSKYIKYLQEANCFHTNDGNCFVSKAQKEMEILQFLGRCIFHFPKQEQFRRIVKPLASKFKENFLSKEYRESHGRESNFYVNMLIDIDLLVADYKSDKEPRLFNENDIRRKFQEQDRICPICKEPISKVQSFTGDHIHPYSAGGKTEYSNLQVTHRSCNLKKGSSIKN